MRTHQYAHKKRASQSFRTPISRPTEVQASVQPALIQAKSNEEGLAEHAERLRKFQRLGNSMMQMGPPRLDDNTNSSVKPKPWIQRKLTIGKPADKYEQEADRVASQVAQHINAPAFTQLHPLQSIQHETNLDSTGVKREQRQPQETNDVKTPVVFRHLSLTGVKLLQLMSDEVFMKHVTKLKELPGKYKRIEYCGALSYDPDFLTRLNESPWRKLMTDDDTVGEDEEMEYRRRTEYGKLLKKAAKILSKNRFGKLSLDKEALECLKTNYWSVTGDEQFGFLIIYEGKGNAKEAFESLFKVLSKGYPIECAQFVQLCQIYALMHTVNKEEFQKLVDASYKKIILRHHFSSGVREMMEVEKVYHRKKRSDDLKTGDNNVLKAAKLNQYLTKVPPGTIIGWTCTTKEAKGTAFEHENTVKVGAGLFAAHGFGSQNIFTMEEIELCVGQTATERISKLVDLVENSVGNPTLGWAISEDGGEISCDAFYDLVKKEKGNQGFKFINCLEKFIGENDGEWRLTKWLLENYQKRLSLKKILSFLTWTEKQQIHDVIFIDSINLVNIPYK